MDETRILEIKDLSFSYDIKKFKPLFKDISFSLKKGDIFTILGPNGVGKSTLFNCINKDLLPQEGEIYLCGKPIHDYDPRMMARHLAYVQQGQEAPFDYTVREYLVMGRNPYIGSLSSPTSEDYKIVEDVLEEFELKDLGDKSIKKISGGERQQIHIARALVQQTDVILLDEPTNHLDFGNQIKVLGIVNRLAKEKNIAILMTTHNPDHAILLGGMTGVLGMDEGMVIGETSEIVTQENLRKIYKTDIHLVDVPVLGRKACIAGNL